MGMVGMGVGKCERLWDLGLTVMALLNAARG